MAWIKSMQELKDHPKLLMLMEKTGWSKPEAIGNLHIFWWWVLAYAEDGDLSRMSLDTPIGNIDLKKLLECGFIDDKTFLVHDWLDYAGRYLNTKYHQTNPAKLKQIERKYKSKSRSTNRTSLGNPKGYTNFPIDRLRKIKKETTTTTSQPADGFLAFRTEIVGIWNEFAGKRALPLVRSTSETREKALRKQYNNAEFMKFWKESLNKSIEQPFLFGKNDRGWKMDFDFLLGKDKQGRENWLKILEGKYGTGRTT